jgi:hypothetical protein
MLVGTSVMSCMSPISNQRFDNELRGIGDLRAVYTNLSCVCTNARVSGIASVRSGTKQVLSYVQLAREASQVCEVGFNCGHSTAAFLEASSAVRVRNFDLPDPRWGARAHKFFRHRYPRSRLHIIEGDSSKTIPSFVSTNPHAHRCDLLVVDGLHTYEGSLLDLIRMVPMAKCNATVVFDDVCDPLACTAVAPTPSSRGFTENKVVVGPTQAWEAAKQLGVVRELARFDLLDRGFAIGRLQLCDDQQRVGLPSANGALPRPIAVRWLTPAQRAKQGGSSRLQRDGSRHTKSIMGGMPEEAETAQASIGLTGHDSRQTRREGAVVILSHRQQSVSGPGVRFPLDDSHPAVIINRRYAESASLDWVYKRSWNGIGSDDEVNITAMWDRKVRLVRDELQNHQYVLSLDDDAFVRKPDVSVESYLQRYPWADLILASPALVGRWQNSSAGSMMEAYAACMSRERALLGVCLVNWGVVIARSTPFVHLLLNTMLTSEACTMQRKTFITGDQACIEQLLLKHPLFHDWQNHVALLPPSDFNCHGADRFSQPCVDPFTVHFYGQMPNKLTVLRRAATRAMAGDYSVREMRPSAHGGRLSTWTCRHPNARHYAPDDSTC